jgi:SAM-dependent methyltransferase
MSNQEIEDWNRVAARYAEFSGDNSINRQFHCVLWECLGDVRGRRVLDVGCGDGHFCGELHEAGAQVLGVDGSRELLRIARERHPQIPFVEHDLSLGLPLGEMGSEPFERVVSNMVLMDIGDLSLLLPSVRQVLAPGGRFVFTMQHPCFFQVRSQRDEDGKLFKKLQKYLQPEVWRLDAFGGHNHYHRSLTFYFDALRHAGLAVTRLFEPPHVTGAARTLEESDFFENIPIFLLIEAAPL